MGEGLGGVDTVTADKVTHMPVDIEDEYKILVSDSEATTPNDTQQQPIGASSIHVASVEVSIYEDTQTESSSSSSYMSPIDFTGWRPRGPPTLAVATVPPKGQGQSQSQGNVPR